MHISPGFERPMCNRPRLGTCSYARSTHIALQADWITALSSNGDDSGGNGFRHALLMPILTTSQIGRSCINRSIASINLALLRVHSE